MARTHRKTIPASKVKSGSAGTPRLFKRRGPRIFIAGVVGFVALDLASGIQRSLQAPRQLVSGRLRVFRSWGSQRAKRAGDCERHPRWPSWVLYLPNSGLRGMGERAAAVRGPEIASGADQDGQIDERYVAGSPAVLSASTVAGVRGRPTKEAARRHARRPKAALEFVEKVFTSARLGLGLGPGSASPPY